MDICNCFVMQCYSLIFFFFNQIYAYSLEKIELTFLSWSISLLGFKGSQYFFENTKFLTNQR